MPSAKIRATLAVALLVLSVVWFWDARVHGATGFISTYVAPVIIIGNLVGAYWGVRASMATFPQWPTLKVLLFWLGVVVVSVAVYQFSGYKGAQHHAAQDQAPSR